MSNRYNRSQGFPRPVVWEESGESVSAGNILILLRWIEGLRTRKGGDLSPGWEDVVSNKICEAPVMSSCCGPAVSAERDVRRIGVSDVFRFLNIMKAWVQAGGVLAPSELSARRSVICASCPHNVSIKGCAGCAAILPKLISLLKGASTPHDEQLEGCGVCGCSLKAKVHLPIEVMVEGDGSIEERFPEWCWMRDESV